MSITQQGFQRFTDPNASPSLQSAIADAYDKLNQISTVSAGSTFQGSFNPLPVDAPGPVQFAMRDIQNKLEMLAGAKASGMPVHITMTIPILWGASRATSDVINDLYTKLAAAASTL
jgi:hypothetical protein